MKNTPLGNENDIAVSTRIRIARNIKGIPYPKRMTTADAKNVIDRVWEALKKSSLGNSLSIYHMEDMSGAEKKSLIERHLISTELASQKAVSAAIISGDETVSIMINEEDHIRLQVFAQGLDAENAYTTAKRIESLLAEEITFDRDQKFGFLTACPTNAGSGLRASVMLHLPAITMSQNVNPLLKWASNLGMTVRGLYGEGSKPGGALFQLSNQITLGVSDKEILSRFTAAACNLISEERRICAELFDKNRCELTDKCLRSLGILKNAYMISSSEAMNLVSNVCMGANSGIIKNIDRNSLRKAMFDTMPYTISISQNTQTDTQRDIKRAQMLQNILLTREE